MRKYLEREAEKDENKVTSYVERPEEEAELEKVFVTSPNKKNAFVSLVGAHAAGKTTLATICYAKWLQEMLKQEEIQVYYVCQSLLDMVEEDTTNVEIWQGIGKRIYSKLMRAYTMENEENNYRREQLRDAYANLKKASTDKESREALGELLGLWREMGLYVILVLDELNALRDVAEEERRAFFKVLYGIAKDTTNYSISILLLSQIRMQDLIGEADKMKDFSSYYKETVLSGFTYAETVQLCKYFDIKDKSKLRGILNYCGTHPGLLGLMCEILSNRTDLSVEEVFSKGKERIEEIYKWYEDELNKVEFLALEGYEDEKIKGIGVYKQVFEADADFDNEFELEEWLDVLCKKGLVGYAKDSRESYAKNGSFVREKGYNYVPVAPHFMEYLRRNEDKQTAEEMRSLRTKLRRLEKQIRKLVYDAYYEILKENNLFSADPDTLSEEIRWEEFNEWMKKAITRHANMTNPQYKNSDKIAMWEGRGNGNGIKDKVRAAGRYALSIIDVLSFTNYYQLISWDGFKNKGWSSLGGCLCLEKVKNSFRCYEELDENNVQTFNMTVMQADFTALKDARNAFAHGSEEFHFIEASEREKVAAICDKLIKSMEEEV